MLLLLLNYVVLRALWKIVVHLISILVNESLYNKYGNKYITSQSCTIRKRIIVIWLHRVSEITSYLILNQCFTLKLEFSVDICGFYRRHETVVMLRYTWIRGLPMDIFNQVEL